MISSKQIYILIKDLTSVEVYAYHLFFFGAYAYNEVHTIVFGYIFEPFNKLRQVAQREIRMFEYAVYVYGLDVVVETDYTIQESDVFVTVCYMFKSSMQITLILYLRSYINL